MLLAFLEDCSEDQRRGDVVGFVLQKCYWIVGSLGFLVVEFNAWISISDFKMRTCLHFDKMYMLGFNMFHMLIKGNFYPTCELSPYVRLPVLCIKLSALFNNDRL